MIWVLIAAGAIGYLIVGMVIVADTRPQPVTWPQKLMDGVAAIGWPLLLLSRVVRGQR